MVLSAAVGCWNSCVQYTTAFLKFAKTSSSSFTCVSFCIPMWNSFIILCSFSNCAIQISFKALSGCTHVPLMIIFAIPAVHACIIIGTCSSSYLLPLDICDVKSWYSTPPCCLLFSLAFCLVVRQLCLDKVVHFPPSFLCLSFNVFVWYFIWPSKFLHLCT